MRDLLGWPWTADELLPFVAGEPVARRFNKTAPRVKSGEIQPEALTAEASMALLADRLLIRRPLMQVGDARMRGFDEAKVDARIGLAPSASPVREGCPRDMCRDD